MRFLPRSSPSLLLNPGSHPTRSPTPTPPPRCLPLSSFPTAAAILPGAPIPSSFSPRHLPIVTAAPSLLLARIHRAVSLSGRPTPFFLPPPHPSAFLPTAPPFPPPPQPHRLPIAVVPARIHVWECRLSSVHGGQVVVSHRRCRPLAAVCLLGTNSTAEAATEGHGTSSGRSPRRCRRFAKTATGEVSRSSIPSGSVGRPCRTFFASPAKAAKQSKQAITSPIGINRSTYLSMCL